MRGLWSVESMAIVRSRRRPELSVCLAPGVHERVTPAPAEGRTERKAATRRGGYLRCCGPIGELWGYVPGVRRRSRPAVAGRPPATGVDPPTGRGAVRGPVD